MSAVNGGESEPSRARWAGSNGGAEECQSGNSCGNTTVAEWGVRSWMLPSTAPHSGLENGLCDMDHPAFGVLSIIVLHWLRLRDRSLPHHPAFVLGATWCVGMVLVWKNMWSWQHWDGCHLVRVPGDHMDMTYRECSPSCLCPSSLVELSWGGEHLFVGKASLLVYFCC